MSTSFISLKPKPLPAPPAITAPSQRVLLKATLQEPEPALVTPKDLLPKARNICGNKEKIGRWSDHEHQVFLEGLESYGKQWKTIAGMIGTRTVVQVRTHAQKYFQKVERSKANTEKKPERFSKRKSLPSSLPSRKKTRKTSTPRLSLSLGAPVSTFIQPYEAPSSSVANPLQNPPALTSHPSYVSKSSSSSGEDWNASISPNAVTDHVEFEVAPDLPFLGDDPLEWLIESEHLLPEGNIPLFPDLKSDKIVESLAPEEPEPAPTVISEDESKGPPEFVQDAIMNKLVDTNVTLQSLLQAPAESP